jgi:DeoR family transcriptional regulator, suf operon transcriptional repressor
MPITHQATTKQDILQYLLEKGQGTAQDLAEALAISPQGIRRHLKDLEAEGLIAHQPVPVAMGRPQHVYELSQEGRDRFPTRYDDFALSLIGTLTETLGEEQASSILHKHWERKALEYRDRVGNGSLQERVANLVALRRAEGYMAEWHLVETNGTGKQFIFAEHNCAISHVASSFPGVCGHELEMFAVALQNCQVERTHWIINGEHRCAYLISQ